MLTMPCTWLGLSIRINQGKQAYHSGDTLLSPHGCGGGRDKVDQQSASSPRYSGQPLVTAHQWVAAPEFEPSVSDSKSQHLIWGGKGRAGCVSEGHFWKPNPEHHFRASRSFLDFASVLSNWQKPKGLLSLGKEKEIRNLGSFAAPGKNQPQWQFGIN